MKRKIDDPDSSDGDAPPPFPGAGRDGGVAPGAPLCLVSSIVCLLHSFVACGRFVVESKSPPVRGRGACVTMIQLKTLFNCFLKTKDACAPSSLPRLPTTSEIFGHGSVLSKKTVAQQEAERALRKFLSWYEFPTVLHHAPHAVACEVVFGLTLVAPQPAGRSYRFRAYARALGLPPDKVFHRDIWNPFDEEARKERASLEGARTKERSSQALRPAAQKHKAAESPAVGVDEDVVCCGEKTREQKDEEGKERAIVLD